MFVVLLDQSICKGNMVLDESSPSELDGGGVLGGVDASGCSAAPHVSLDGDFSLADADITSTNIESSHTSLDVCDNLGDDTLDSNKTGAEHLLAEFVGTSVSDDDDDSQADIDELTCPKRNLVRVFDVVDSDDVERVVKRKRFGK